jgi:hypothetical protein
LADDDRWQIGNAEPAYDKRRRRELDFWFGVRHNGSRSAAAFKSSPAA